jgi:hypothetical protein
MFHNDDFRFPAFVFFILVAFLTAVFMVAFNIDASRKDYLIVEDGFANPVVNYKIPLKELIASGHYDEVDAAITEEHFLLQDAEVGPRVAFKLFVFTKTTPSEEIIMVMQKEGCRPATLRELVAFGNVNPEAQTNYGLVGLGSIWTASNKVRYVPVLNSSSRKRYLEIERFVAQWSVRCRFVAVCE